MDREITNNRKLRVRIKLVTYNGSWSVFVVEYVLAIQDIVCKRSQSEQGGCLQGSSLAQELKRATIVFLLQLPNVLHHATI